MEDRRKEPISAGWRKFEITGKVLGWTLIPVLIAFVGHSYTDVIRAKEMELRYVELAVDILKQKPAKDSAELRSWAIKIVDKFAPLPLSEKAKEELKYRQLRTYP
jgi:hypothetical protein